MFETLTTYNDENRILMVLTAVCALMWAYRFLKAEKIYELYTRLCAQPDDKARDFFRSQHTMFDFCRLCNVISASTAVCALFSSCFTMASFCLLWLMVRIASTSSQRYSYAVDRMIIFLLFILYVGMAVALSPWGLVQIKA